MPNKTTRDYFINGYYINLYYSISAPKDELERESMRWYSFLSNFSVTGKDVYDFRFSVGSKRIDVFTGGSVQFCCPAEYADKNWKKIYDDY